MLYDPRRDRLTTELDSIVVWLETRRPGRRYRTDRVYTCLFGRYALAQGIGKGVGPLTRLRLWHRESNRLFSLYQHIATGGPRTYGAAAERARELRGW